MRKPIIMPTRPQAVNSQNMEFGYELIAILPYAYYLHQRGLLKETISGIDTDCLYYFSPKHTCNPEERRWSNVFRAQHIPNVNIHRPVLDKRFSPPPLKEQYKNERFVFDKPIVCICNRVNKEWGREVINYFDIDCLTRLFEFLRNDYHIIYFNIRGKKGYYDGPEQIDISDYELAKSMGVTTIHDLQKQNPDLSFNHLQLMVMANSERFITMNGGYSILASYMGGTNIIYSKKCHELKPRVNSFYRWYHRFGGSRILHVNNYEDLFSRVNDLFIKKSPVLNIVMRACQRPRYFASAYKSIVNQSNKNINLIVGYHDNETQRYLIPYKINPVRYAAYAETIRPHSDSVNYGRAFPSNHYFNTLFRKAKDGWVMVLDDDDAFTTNDAAEKILSHITSEDDLILWRINIGGRMIPSDENFGKAPVVRDISSIAFCCHKKHLEGYVSEPYKRWDYRILSFLYKKLNPVWVDATYTKIQGETEGGGYKKDKA